MTMLDVTALQALPEDEQDQGLGLPDECCTWTCGTNSCGVTCVPN